MTHSTDGTNVMHSYHGYLNKPYIRIIVLSINFYEGIARKGQIIWLL